MKELVYKIVNAFTGGRGLRKKINGFFLRLPTRYINYFPETYEQENFLFLQRQVKAGDKVLDIGAHIGLFSVIAAQLVGKNGKVYAFEPAAETNSLLKQTVAINKLESIVETYQEAMGEKSGKATFYVSAVKGDNSNSTVSYKDDRKLFAMEVNMLSIDDFVKAKNLDKLSFIKIDVEGAEYDTLRGAENTLRNLQPACILAIHPEPIAAKGDSLENIYDLVSSSNYHIYYLGKIISKEDFCSNRELIDLHLLPAQTE
jgi:FkbM family methyltransferase